MLTLDPQIAALIQAEEIHGAFWLVKLELAGGDQYFSEGGEFTWDGHEWEPFLDPENPVDGVKSNIKCDEKLETTITLANVNHAISDLLKTNDFQGRTARIYIYFPSIAKGVQVFRGVMGKPERVGDYQISVPVTSYLHGPKTKLPSGVFASTCRFRFADGVSCPYDPAGGKGRVNPATGLPFTSCPGTGAACTGRGMRGSHTSGVDYFGGFEKWQATARGRLNNSGFLGIGRNSYSSEATIQDNFLGAAIPLVYGEIKLPAQIFFFNDESEFLLVGGMIADGKLNDAVAILANGEPTHDFKYPPFFTHGWIGQAVPEITGYSADPFSGTAYGVIRIHDEVGIQADRSVDMVAHVQGRVMRQYYRAGETWLFAEDVYTNAPTDVWIDLIANTRGGLGLGYDKLDLDLNWERDYSNELILDVDGVQRKRYTLNGAILDHQPAGDVLERIRDEFSMFFRDSGETITFGFIRPNKTAVFTFGESARTVLVEDGLPRIEIWERSASDVPNRMYFSFLDASNGYEKTTFHLESAGQIEQVGKVVDESVYLTCTTNIGQALRIASNRMEREISGNWFAEWTAPIKALAVEVGDVVTVATALLPGGSDTFLVTEKEIGPDFSIRFTGQLYRSAFYDDAVADEYEDILRGAPDNPLRPPAEVEDLTAAETVVVTPEGATRSEIAVTWTLPADKLWKEAEVWYRDVLRDPEDAWTLGDVTDGTKGGFVLEANEYRLLKIRVRSVSRYGIRRDLNADEIPEVELLADGSPDDGVPDAPVNLLVRTRSDDATIPENVFRVTFEAGAANWKGVHSIYVETNAALPFSDGTVQVSNGQSVSGTGAIVAGDSKITDESKSWTPDDPALVGCIAILEDAGGNIQGRMVTGNSAITIRTSGPWYRPTGSYTYRVVSNFTRENFRGYLYEVKRGDFNPLQGTFAFDIPLTNVELYFRVAAFNAFGISDWTITAAAISNCPGYDTTQAPKVTAFDAAVEGFTGPDGAARCLVTFSWTGPDPLANFSHVRIFANRPIESGMGIPSGGGGESGGGWFEHLVGEFWDTGQNVVTFPSTDPDDPVTFYAVSVNNDGYYNPNWYAEGDFVSKAVFLLPDDTPPAAVANLAAAAGNGVLIVAWDENAEWDIEKYHVQVRARSTTFDPETPWTGEIVFPGPSWEWWGRHTITQITPETAMNGWYFQARVRAIDNVDHEGAWAASGVVQVFAGAFLQPVAVPTGISVGKSAHTQAGVTLIDLSVTWDNPSDIQYGGAEVWVVYTDTNPAERRGWRRITAVDAPDSDTAFSLPADGSEVVVRLIPYNKTRIVPDYLTYASSAAVTLTPSGITLAAPDVVAHDGIGKVVLLLDIPPVTGHAKLIDSVEVFISKDSASANAELVKNHSLANIHASAEAATVEISWDEILALKTAGELTYDYQAGALYYFFAKVKDTFGNRSAFSDDTATAIFIRPDVVAAGVPGYASGAEVMRLAINGAALALTVYWNAPTVNGETVYQTQIQVSNVAAFGTVLADVVLDTKTGAWGWAAANAGTYYVRVRSRNNCAANDGWGSWYGLREGTSYATAVVTAETQTADLTFIPAASVSLAFEEIIQQDALGLDVTVAKGGWNNYRDTSTCLNITVLWSATNSKLADSNNIVTSGFTVSWADNDSWIQLSAAASPAESWIGKVLQYQLDANDRWGGGIITAVDAGNKRVLINCSWGAAASGKTARVIVGYWEREGVWFEEIGKRPNVNQHIELGKAYRVTINQIQSPATAYVRVIAHNQYGPGTPKSDSHSTGDKGYKAAFYTSGYTSGQSPTGQFSNTGGQWFEMPNSTFTRELTFTYTQSAGLDPNEYADSFVVVYREGGGTPDPATDPKAVFSCDHTSGAADYKLRIEGLDPFKTYSFRIYAAKNVAAGMALSSGYMQTLDTTPTSTDHLTLKPKTTTGVVKVLSYTGGNDGVLAVNTIVNPGVGYGVNINLTASPTKIGGSTIELVNKFYLSTTAAQIVAGDPTGTLTSDLELTTVDSGKIVKALRKLLANAGFEVNGEARCDTLRIDADPASGTITPDKLIEVSMNGTVYQVPCKAKP